MNNNAGQDKSLWEKIIKQKMVTVQGSKSTYKFNDKKNSSVEIHYGASLMKVPLRRTGPPAETQPAVGQGNATLDVASPDFLVLSRHPTAMNYKHFIPWRKIVEIVFVDA
jgi:hypothetical protein